MTQVQKSSAKRIKELVASLTEASDAYYNLSDPIMSDAEFDRLRDELEELDPDNPFLRQVGADIDDDSSLTEVKHSIPMGSLKKINTGPEFDTWLKSVGKAAGANPECAVQWKLDGSSLELIFRNGAFVQAVTRGDGEIGEDVTHSIRLAQGFPRTLPGKDNLSVRCEAILKISDWKKHLAGEGMKNPRNAAAGIVRRSDTKDAKHLHCMAFNVEFIDGAQKWDSEEDKMAWLRKAGFETVDTSVISAKHVPAAVASLEANRKSMDFEVDGAVVKLNARSQQEELGEHAGRPYWARAWKFAPMGGHTKIIGAEWEVGTRGTITPVAIVEPVDVGGVTIRRATLHNLDEIVRLGIKIGDDIEIIRANDVIPKIVRVVKTGQNRKNIWCPECPNCGGEVHKSGPHLVCKNKKSCTGVQFRRLMAWAKKREIMYLGESAMKQLVDAKVVKSVADLYSLDKAAMVKAGLGGGEADRLLPELEKSRKVALHDLIGSLSIDLLGRSEAKNIVKLGFTKLSDWKSLRPDDLMKHEGYKDVSAGRICDGLKEAWPLIEELAGILDVEEKAAKPQGGKLSGKSFCFTGEMKKPRKELESLVEANGGTIGSVSKHLTYLVTADTDSSSGKSEKARKLGVQMISEDDFLKMI